MATKPLEDEKELLDSLAKGDEEAFSVIFNHYQDHIFKVALNFVKSHGVAEEMVQDIFLKVWEKRSSLYELANFQNWLFIISRNYLINYLKKIALDETTRSAWVKEMPLFENSTDYKLREARFSTLLQKIISTLPNQQQQVFLLARNQFLSYAEIAEKLAISANTVRIHMSRALASIRRSLNEEGIEYVLLLMATSSLFIST